MYIPTSIAAGYATSKLEEPTVQWSNLIGIVTAICGNILISFALNTQRYAHMRLGHDRDIAQEKQQSSKRQSRSTQEDNGAAERQPLLHKNSSSSSSSTSDTYVGEEKDEPQTKTYLRSPIWWLGIGMMILGEAGNFLAYGFAPASIVSPLGVVALISNCLIAPLLLHEKFRARDAIGVIIAIGGCVTVVLSASGSNPKLSPKDIWYLVTRWEFETYMGITIFLMIVLMIASNRFGDRTVLIDLGLVGLFGGYTALSTKGVASLLSNTIWRAFTFPITYLLVAVLVATAVLQIKYINRALQRFNATIVIPTQFVLFTISVIVGSAVLYRDFEKESAEDAGKFIGGCALTFLGVWLITSGRSDDNNDEDDNSKDEQEQQDEHIDIVDEEAESSITEERRPLTARATTTSRIPPKVLISEDDSDVVDKQIAVAAGPANRAAVHPSVRPMTSDPIKAPPLHATTSEPSVPVLDRSQYNLAPRTPSRRRPSDGRQVSPTLEASPAHRLLGRHSIADLLPGPLMSPLSSSLSAIVADSLRRGVDHTPMSTLRSRSFRVSRRQTGDDVPAKRHSIDSTDIIVEPDRPQTRPQASRSVSGRNRSFSATISDIFGAALNRHKSHDPAGSER